MATNNFQYTEYCESNEHGKCHQNPNHPVYVDAQLAQVEYQLVNKHITVFIDIVNNGSMRASIVGLFTSGEQTSIKTITTIFLIVIHQQDTSTSNQLIFYVLAGNQVDYRMM